MEDGIGGNAQTRNYDLGFVRENAERARKDSEMIIQLSDSLNGAMLENKALKEECANLKTALEALKAVPVAAVPAP